MGGFEGPSFNPVEAEPVADEKKEIEAKKAERQWSAKDFEIEPGDEDEDGVAEAGAEEAPEVTLQTVETPPDDVEVGPSGTEFDAQFSQASLENTKVIEEMLLNDPDIARKIEQASQNVRERRGSGEAKTENVEYSPERKGWLKPILEWANEHPNIRRGVAALVLMTALARGVGGGGEAEAASYNKKGWDIVKVSDPIFKGGRVERGHQGNLEQLHVMRDRLIQEGNALKERLDKLQDTKEDVLKKGPPGNKIGDHEYKKDLNDLRRDMNKTKHDLERVDKQLYGPHGVEQKIINEQTKTDQDRWSTGGAIFKGVIKANPNWR